MKEKLEEIFLEFWLSFTNKLPDIFLAFLILLLFFTVGYFLFKLINKRFAAKWSETIATRFAVEGLKWIFYLVGIMIAVDVLGWSSMFSSLAAGAGITAIILGFAFKDIIENFLAGILLAANSPFGIGNIIEVDNHKGVVKGMDLRTTHIRNVEGKDIFIPNAMIVKNVVINYTRDGLLRQEFAIGLDVPSDVVKAKELIMAYLTEQAVVLKKPEANVIVTGIGEFTVNLKVLFWVNILKEKSASPSYLGITIRSRIIHEVKDLLLENGFNLPSQVLEHKLYKDPIQVTIDRA